MAELKKLKKELRDQHLSKRNLMSLEEVNSKSASICQLIINSEDFKRADQLFCFYPLGKEVDILPIVLEGFEQGKIICFPKVMDKKTIRFYKVNTLDDFELGKFNVMEPITTLEIKPSINDLMIVPGLVFDKSNGRIGYGGGYYDRYIQAAMTINPEFTTFGVCYKWQLIEDLPKADYDQELYRIIYEQS